MSITDVLSGDEIIYLGLLPAKIFTSVSSANKDITVLEAKEFSIYLLKFYNANYNSFICRAIETLETIPLSQYEKKTEIIDKKTEKYFIAVKKIIDNFPENEKLIVYDLIKNLAVSIASASNEYYGLGANISAAESIILNEIFSIFNLC